MWSSVRALIGLWLLFGSVIAARAEEPVVATLVLNEYQFIPALLKLPKGRPIVLRLRNQGKEKHEFVTAAFEAVEIEVHGSGIEVGGKGITEIELEPGRKVEITLPALAAGQYDIICEATGHLDRGMKATLVVE